MTETPGGALLGYARVSTDQQSTAMQLDALDRAGVARVWQDSMTGARLDRPGLDELLRYARSGDVVVVYSLSRVSRSTRDLLALVDQLDAAGIGLRSLTEPVDTSSSSPAARFTVQLLAALSEMERAILRERTAAGVAAARSRGRVGGQRPVPAETAAALLRLTRSGTPVAEAARVVGVGRSTAYRLVARAAETPAAV